jgi:hypothetical protein
MDSGMDSPEARRLRVMAPIHHLSLVSTSPVRLLPQPNKPLAHLPMKALIFSKCAGRTGPGAVATRREAGYVGFGGPE